MHTLSLGLSYIVQDRKFERHKFSSKHQSCMCGCDVFPAVQASFIAGHVRYLVNAMLVSLFWHKMFYSRYCFGF